MTSGMLFIKELLPFRVLENGEHMSCKESMTCQRQVV